MEETVVINKKDLTRLGNNVLKELYEFFNDEYMLTYPEVKEEGTNFINKLITAEFEKKNYILIQREYSTSIINERIGMDEFNKRLKCLKDRIENGKISLDIIIEAIRQIEYKNGMNELDEDLHGKVSSFVNIYNVFTCDYSYLKD